MLELSLAGDGEDAGFFVVGVSSGEEGMAYVCPPRSDAEPAGPDPDGAAAIHGPYLVVHRRGVPATVHAFGERTGEVTLPFASGESLAELPERVPCTVIASYGVAGGVDPSEVGELWLERVASPGTWAPPITPQLLTTEAIPRPGYGVPVGVPAPGRYRWVDRMGSWASKPFEIERGDETRRAVLEVAAPR